MSITWATAKSALAVSASLLVGVGIILAGATRQNQDRDFRLLGTSVDEAGGQLGDAFIPGWLTSSWYGSVMIWMVVGLSALTFLFFWLLHRYKALVEEFFPAKDWIAHEPSQSPPVGFGNVARLSLQAYVPGIAAMCILVLTFVFISAIHGQLARTAIRGAEANQAGERDFDAEIFLGVQANCVTVVPDKFLAGLGSSMLIGVSDTHLLLMAEGGRGRLWRVPVGQATLQTTPLQEDEACPRR